VVDATQMGGSTSTAKSLVAAGIKVHSWGAPFRLMHDKVLVVDTKVCALGSYNWTTQAQKSNVEVLLMTRGRVGNRLAQALSQQVLTTFSEGKPILI
jgi:phosphatidylserine/phosphatidylglycerophosphate/cardiolipin synthase-like enzyme